MNNYNFQNALANLIHCQLILNDPDTDLDNISNNEKEAMMRLFSVCKEVADYYYKGVQNETI